MIKKEILYEVATNLARVNNQVVGEKNDYYITLEQLMDLLQAGEAEVSQPPPEELHC